MNLRNLHIWFSTVIYMTGATIWIFLSDALLADFVSPNSIQWFSTIKGLFFVAVTTVFLFWVLRATPDHEGVPSQYRSNHIETALLLEEDAPQGVVYLLAIALPVIAAMVRLSMPNNWHHSPMLELFMLPIILNALIGGLWPGLLSTVTSTLLVLLTTYITDPVHLFLPQTLLPLAFLSFNGLLISFLSGSLRSSIANARKSNALLDTVIKGTSDAVFIKDTNKRYVLVNPVVTDFLGRPAQEIIGKTDVELFDAASAENLYSKDHYVLSTKSKISGEEHLRSPNGEDRVWAITKGPILNHKGDITGLFGISHDVTALHQHLDLLKTNEERFRLALEATSDGFWDWNLKTGEVFRSAGYMQVMGHELENDSRDFDFLMRVLHPDDKDWVLATIQTHIKGETPHIRMEFRIVTAKQEVRWVRVRGRALSRDEHHQATRVLGTLQNITDAHRTTQDLQLVLNEACEAIWIANSKGQFLYANPAACKLSGYSPEALLHRSIRDLLTPEDVAHIPRYLQELHENAFIQREWTVVKQDGTRVPVDVLSERLPDGRIINFGRDLSDEKKILTNLQQREQQLARVLEGSDQGFWEWHLPSNHFSTNDHFSTMVGYQPGELNVALENWPNLVHEEDIQPLWEAIDRHKAGLSTHVEIVFRMRRADGGWHWILSRGRIVERAADGTPVLMSGTHTDYNERKKTELLMQQALVVFEHVQEAILMTTQDGAIRRVNPAFEHITGYTEAEVLGKNPRFMSSSEHPPSFFEQMYHALKEHGRWQGEIWNRHKNRRVYPCRMSISEIRDERGVLQLYVGVFSDITKEKAHEAELQRIAHHDLLTGLPNRLLLGKELADALIQTQLEDQYVAICYLDLDGFKTINDYYGHSAGDQLLIHTAEKLRAVLRRGDMLARPGGDEFVLLLTGLNHPHEVQRLAEQVLSTIQGAVRIEEHDLAVSASMGITLYPADDADADTLLRHADQAMYMAKELGKNRYVVFDPVHDRQLQTQRDLLKRLEQAYQQREFVLHYQPKVDLSDGRVIGAEALIRWQHPDHGLLSPGEFIHALDNSPLEKLIGQWVICEALIQLDLWMQMGLNFQISVNISAGHLLQDDFIPFLEQQLLLHPNVHPHQLELEILETAGLADMDRAIETLKQCHALGVSFALDDFGTGYSSLAYFRKLPVQLIKIDQSFVRNMLTDENDLEIVESVVRLARAFNRPVIAEGVETLAHCTRLLEMGCHLAQGYGIGKPMSVAMFPDWLENWKTTAPWTKLPPSHPSTTLAPALAPAS